MNEWNGAQLFEYGNLDAYVGEPGNFGLYSGHTRGAFGLQQHPFDDEVFYEPYNEYFWSQWHHLCVTYGNGDRWNNITLYADGQTGATWNATFVNTGSDAPLRFGASVNDSAPSFLNGSLDDIAIYKTDLDSTEIQRLYYDSATPRPTAFPSSAPFSNPTVSSSPTIYTFQSSLVGYYPMTDGRANDTFGLNDGQPYRYNATVSKLSEATSRDGSTEAIRLDPSFAEHVRFNVTQTIAGGAPRSICVWARIDEWDGAQIFEYGSREYYWEDGAATGSVPSKLFGLGLRRHPGSFFVTNHPSETRNVTIELDEAEWDQWHHYCVTYGRRVWGTNVWDNATFYFDGERRATWNATVDTGADEPLYLGASTSWSRWLGASLDELYVYSAELPGDAIYEIYRDATVPPTTTNPSPSPTLSNAPTTYVF